MRLIYPSDKHVYTPWSSSEAFQLKFLVVYLGITFEIVIGEENTINRPPGGICSKSYK